MQSGSICTSAMEDCKFIFAAVQTTVPSCVMCSLLPKSGRLFTQRKFSPCLQSGVVSPLETQLHVTSTSASKARWQANKQASKPTHTHAQYSLINLNPFDTDRRHFVDSLFVQNCMHKHVYCNYVAIFTVML